MPLFLFGWLYHDLNIDEIKISEFKWFFCWSYGMKKCGCMIFLVWILSKVIGIVWYSWERVFTKQSNGNLFFSWLRLGRNSKKLWAFWKLIKLILRSSILSWRWRQQEVDEEMFLERRNLRMGFTCLLRSLTRSSIVGWDLVSLKILLQVCVYQRLFKQISWGSYTFVDIFQLVIHFYHLIPGWLDPWWRINS